MMAEKRQHETALVYAAQGGDKEALQQLLIRNWSWLKGLVYSVLNNSDDVDDVLQDVCIRVIDKIDSLREPECFKSWLAVLARRQALRNRQQRSARPMQLDEELVDQKFQIEDQLFENIEEQQQKRQIQLAIESLPEKYREVFMLQHSGDLTYGQIAEVLDIPITTVQIRLVRARKLIYDKIINREKIGQ